MVTQIVLDFQTGSAQTLRQANSFECALQWALMDDSHIKKGQNVRCLTETFSETEETIILPRTKKKKEVKKGYASPRGKYLCGCG